MCRVSVDARQRAVFRGGGGAVWAVGALTVASVGVRIGRRAVHDGRARCLSNFNSGEERQVSFEAVEAPESDKFCGRAVARQRVIKMVVVKMGAHQFLDNVRDICEISDHVALAAVRYQSGGTQLDGEHVAVTVQVGAFAVMVHELVGGFEGKALA